MAVVDALFLVGVPQNMDALTPLDASQIPGLTPASFMFAFRAWSTAESQKFGLTVKQEPVPTRAGSSRSKQQGPVNKKRRRA